MKIVSWNVNSIRKRVEEVLTLIDTVDPDIICLQETKCSQKSFKEYQKSFGGYPNIYWNDAIKGQAGVCIFSKIPFLGVSQSFENFPVPGRLLIAECEDFVLINVYVPNTGRGPIAEDYRTQWHEELMNWLESHQGKNIIMCGDFNVVRNVILDTNTHVIVPKVPCAGLKQFERDQFEEYIKFGLRDVFRTLFPEKKEYTWFSYRVNACWRLDYFLTNMTFKESTITHGSRDTGSDHVYVLLEFMTPL